MIALGIVGGIAILLLIFLISTFNNLSRLRVLAEEGWSGIGTYLQQRLDMLPNLVEVVKGYAGHENKTLNDVIKARNESIAALTPEAQVEAAKHMGAAMINFKSLAEGYPDLKANTNFIKLQEQLAEMEERLNQSRRYYNGTVRDYNQAIAVFPGNIIAGMFGFQVKPFFAEEEVAAKAPKVQF
ncbi:MAG: LemA family protein [Chitinophagales bacterium]